jgi:hypothetical protein
MMDDPRRCRTGGAEYPLVCGHGPSDPVRFQTGMIVRKARSLEEDLDG